MEAPGARGPNQPTQAGAADQRLKGFRISALHSPEELRDVAGPLVQVQIPGSAATGKDGALDRLHGSREAVAGDVRAGFVELDAHCGLYRPVLGCGAGHRQGSTDTIERDAQGFSSTNRADRAPMTVRQAWKMMLLGARRKAGGEGLEVGVVRRKGVGVGQRRDVI